MLTQHMLRDRRGKRSLIGVVSVQAQNLDDTVENGPKQSETGTWQSAQRWLRF